MARYLAVRAVSGASIATLRLVTSAIAKAPRVGRPRVPRPGPWRARGIEGLGPPVGQAPASGRRPHRRRARRHPAHRSETPCPRPRLRNASRPPSVPASTWPWWPSSLTGGLRRSEAAALTWGDVQRWDDGSGRITVIRSKTDAEAQGAVVAVTPAAMRRWTPSGRPALVVGRRCSGCRSPRSPGGVKAVARAAGLADWEFFSGHRRAGGHGEAHGPERRAPRTRSNARVAGSRAAAWSAATTAASPPGRRYGICSAIRLEFPSATDRAEAAPKIRHNCSQGSIPDAYGLS